MALATCPACSGSCHRLVVDVTNNNIRDYGACPACGGTGSITIPDPLPTPTPPTPPTDDAA